MRSPRGSRVTSEAPASRFVCDAIVTDIEGTTGSIAFVRDVLFPYAREHLGQFLETHADDDEVKASLDQTALLAGEPEAPAVRLIQILETWIDEDRKATPLKTLQGRIWADGYARGILIGDVYSDAAANLARWHAAGFRLYVYSSGSVAAQKLLFGHSTAGDLTSLFSAYFDTTTGVKSDPAAYTRIATLIAEPPADVLFLSDREEELDAAATAGWQTACLARPEDGTPLTGRHPCFGSFDQIVVERRHLG